MAAYTAIGTRTGKVRHYTADTDINLGYARTLCYKTVRTPIVFPNHAVNCQKCADEHDFTAGSDGHALRINDLGEGADWRGGEGFCCCGEWTTTVLRDEEHGRVGHEIVGRHRQHVIDTYRASRTA